MSGFLVNKSLLDPTVTQYSGGTASFTLPQSGSTNATEVFVGGVPQVAGVDFNVSGTALTLTTSAPAGSNMVCARQYFSDGITGTPAANSVATAAVQDNAINLAKMAGGTDGNIISFDSSGDPVYVATGNDGQVLTSAGAGAQPAFEDAGGAWNIVGTSVASSSASLTITGLDSTYDTYAVGLSDIVPATDAQNGVFRFGDSSGIDSGASDYGWSCFNYQINNTSANSTGAEDSADSEMQLGATGAGGNIGNAAGEGVGGIFYIHRPTDGTTFPTIDGVFTAVESGSSAIGGRFHGIRWSDIDLDRVQFYFSSGNIATGRMTVWGIAHA